MAEKSGKMGRPKKLDDSRRIYSIYIDEGLMSEVDAFVFAEKMKYSDYSRSDFFNDAVGYYLAGQKKE